MRTPPSGQVGDLIHQPEQFAVVADDHHHPGPGRDRVVQPPARVQIQVVGRLVQQHDVRPPQEQRGQRDQDGLTAGQPFHPVIEPHPAEPQPVQPGAGALLDVPVVPDRREGRLPGLTRLDSVQGVPGGGDAEQVRHAAAGPQGDGLRQVAHLAAGATAPEPGRSSPAISLSRVDLPEPLTPISPVRPGPKDTVRPDSTGAPSGQLKLRSEQTIAAIMRRGSQHVGMISVTCGDTTPRGSAGGHAHAGQAQAQYRDLTASTHSPPPTSETPSF